eukprot:3489423-Rhodomonas_salina.1
MPGHHIGTGRSHVRLWRSRTLPSGPTTSRHSAARYGLGFGTRIRNLDSELEFEVVPMTAGKERGRAEEGGSRGGEVRCQALRMRVHGSRFTVHRSRFTVHGFAVSCSGLRIFHAGRVEG